MQRSFQHAQEDDAIADLSHFLENVRSQWAISRNVASQHQIEEAIGADDTVRKLGHLHRGHTLQQLLDVRAQYVLDDILNMLCELVDEQRDVSDLNNFQHTANMLAAEESFIHCILFLKDFFVPALFSAIPEVGKDGLRVVALRGLRPMQRGFHEPLGGGVPNEVGQHIVDEFIQDVQHDAAAKPPDGRIIVAFLEN